MAGLNHHGVFATRGLQRLEYPQILYLSEFHHIPLMWHLIEGCYLLRLVASFFANTSHFMEDSLLREKAF